MTGDDPAGGRAASASRQVGRSRPGHPPVGCRVGLTRDPQALAAGLLGGALRLAPYDPVPATPVDLWSQPSRGTTWDFRLHSLMWLLVVDSAAQEDGRFDGLAEAYVRSWLAAFGEPVDGSPAWAAHQTALRAQALSCLAQRWEAEWLLPTLDLHAARLEQEDHYSGAWNHGVDEIIGLLAASQVTGHERGLQVALRRAGELMDEVVDGEGTTNEQAIGYQDYSFRVLSLLAQSLSSCGLAVDELGARRRRMGRLLLHAVQPDGRWVPLGDTQGGPQTELLDLDHEAELRYALTGGRLGTAPTSRVGVFTRGFVLGRSTWRGPDPGLLYSLRFGEPRRLHGHRDHTAVTLYAGGRPVLGEAGFGGYDDAAARAYERSELAHNQVLWSGQGPYRWEAWTSLAAWRQGDDHESFVVVGEPWTSTVRRRSLLVDHRLRCLVVVDDLRSLRSGTARQRWHLGPSFTARAEGRRTVAHDAAGPVTILQLAGVQGVSVEQGVAEPMSGWTAVSLGERVPNAVAVTRASGSKVRFVTVVGLHEDVSGEVVTTHPDGGLDLTVRVGGLTRRLRSGVDGLLLPG